MAYTSVKQVAKQRPLLKTLREEMRMRMKGGIYHRTQIDLTYNSNHIEGSRLTHDQTRYIFETNTIGIGGSVKVDDIVETANHFRCIDGIFKHINSSIANIALLHRSCNFVYIRRTCETFCNGKPIICFNHII